MAVTNAPSTYALFIAREIIDASAGDRRRVTEVAVMIDMAMDRAVDMEREQYGVPKNSAK